MLKFFQFGIYFGSDNIELGEGGIWKTGECYYICVEVSHHFCPGLSEPLYTCMGAYMRQSKGATKIAGTTLRAVIVK